VRARVDLHCHSSLSYDGAVAPQQLVELARQRGLTHLAITDHETLEGALLARRDAPADLLVIVGQEARTTEGDLIGLFVQQPIAAGLTPEETARLIREQGGIVGLAHPFDARRPSIGRGAGRPADLRRLAALVDYVEVHNGRVTDEFANERAATFARSHGLPLVAVSDAHTEPELGTAATVLDGFPRTAEEFLGALRGGTQLVARASYSGDAQPHAPLRGFLVRLRGTKGSRRRSR
jgi:predicted metal-dependent phosphoesterase TrpH